MGVARHCPYSAPLHLYIPRRLFPLSIKIKLSSMCVIENWMNSLSCDTSPSIPQGPFQTLGAVSVAATKVKTKNATLCEIQAKMLSAPRKERTQLRTEAATLESEIQHLQARIDLERVDASLRLHLAADDSQMITSDLEELSNRVQDNFSCCSDVTASLANLVVSGMVTHPTDRNVQYFGCRGLANLVLLMAKSGEQDWAVNTVWVAGARVAVGKARRIYASDIDVTEWADQVLRHA